jgi:hypothetical protein
MQRERREPMTKQLATREMMHERLRANGLTVEGWARSQGINEGIASKVVSRYVGKPRRPGGPTGKRVLEGLERVTGLRLSG